MSSDQALLRKQIVASASTVVVKVGTRVLTHPDGRLDDAQIVSLANQLVELTKQGKQVVLVSSGSVGAGLGRLGLDARPNDLAQLQAVAAVGQSALIEAYNRAFETHGKHAAQVLLTADDLNDRTRYLNIRNTILQLFRFGAIPIINENDTVRVFELQQNVGDNDRLAAMVTNLLKAPLLVLLSDVDGLFDGDPTDPESNVLSVVEQLDANTMNQVFSSKKSQLELSTGGMATKIEAAQIATAAGENVVIANGRQPRVLLDILAGKNIGTLFPAQGEGVASKKRWIGWAAQPQGSVSLDPGAERAIRDEGKSLLAVGITLVEGNFQKGDVLSILSTDGNEFARGLTNYSSDDLTKIARKPTEQFTEILGHCPYREVIHRDNLTLVR